MTNISFHVLIADDEIAEQRETFWLYIYSGSLYYLVKTYQFSHTTVYIEDNDGNNDYISGPYNVTFPSGATNASFSVRIADDSITENTEAFLLNINPASLSNNLVFGDHDRAVVTIIDNDFTTINFDKTAYSIDEYNGAIHPVLILSNPVSKDVTVKVLNTDGSADGDVDYSGSLSQSDAQIDIDSEEGDDDYGSGPYFIKFTAGMIRVPFNISIRDDNRVEKNENFFLTIDKSTLPCDVTVGNQDQTTVTILEDDSTGCIVNTISGNITHDQQQGRTVLTFNADNANATYTCKLDQEPYTYCTSPKTWNNLENGKHTVNVKASCVIDGTTFSSTKLKIEFQVR